MSTNILGCDVLPRLITSVTRAICFPLVRLVNGGVPSEQCSIGEFKGKLRGMIIIIT